MRSSFINKLISLSLELICKLIFPIYAKPLDRIKKKKGKESKIKQNKRKEEKNEMCAIFQLGCDHSP